MGWVIAIVCGKDPADGKFFIGTKGVFNKNPKIKQVMHKTLQLTLLIQVIVIKVDYVINLIQHYSI